MQIKTNVRAGQGQKQKRGSSTDSSSTEVVVPVTARCPGV